MKALFATLLVLLAACTPTPRECDASTPCEFGYVCSPEGQCLVSECSTSAQCPMEHYCDARKCVEGCQVDGDCYPGYGCNTDLGVCEKSPCHETNVDCGFREFCNQVTGECYDAGGKYCKPCDPDNEVNDCGTGNLCLAGYCGVDCSGGKPCPSGFDCYPWEDRYGNVIAFQCFTYCWLYEDYDPGSFVVDAPTCDALAPMFEDEDLQPGEAL